MDRTAAVRQVVEQCLSLVAELLEPDGPTPADPAPTSEKARLCKSCEKPILGHGNAETHPGECRRAERAKRARAAYQAKSQAHAFPERHCAYEFCRRLFWPNAPKHKFCSRKCARAAAALAQRAPKKQRQSASVMPVPDDAILRVLQTSGPIAERDLCAALGLTTAEALDALTVRLEALQQSGRARHAAERWTATISKE